MTDDPTTAGTPSDDERLLPADLRLPLSTIGSFPKPERLKQARAGAARGALPAEELRRVEREETAACLRVQETLGLDLLVDGEMYRGDMTTYFAEQIEGFRISGLVRSYGNRYYRKPIVVGPVRWPRPVTVDWFRFALEQTRLPVKAILTGPYTMMDWSFDEHYGSRETLAMALAEVIRQEAEALVGAGARYVQIDEPAVSVRPDEIDLAIRAMGTVTEGLRARTITHICYGDFPAISSLWSCRTRTSGSWSCSRPRPSPRSWGRGSSTSTVTRSSRSRSSASGSWRRSRSSPPPDSPSIPIVV